MKSGGGVLLVSCLQLVVGLVLLGVYEGYKRHYLLSSARTIVKDSGLAAPPALSSSDSSSSSSSEYGSMMNMVMGSWSPMELLFYVSAVNNIFALCGIAGMFARLRQLVVAFFVYNLVNVVMSFHVFVDVCVGLRIAHHANRGAPSSLGGYERTAAAFLFFEFMLSMLACVFAIKAVEEIKDKKRDETRQSIEMGMPL